jgi:glycosyltransferase involved in cell wall biosynthesis
MPKVSVVIPSYNRADFISATLGSVLSQTYEDFEVLFIDDGSTDNTAEIVDSFIEKDYRLKYFRQSNSERAVARNYGISLSNSKYLCLVDSDDLWYPQKLEKQVELMDSSPDIALTYASVNRIDLNNRRLNPAPRQQQGYSAWVFYKLLERNFIPSVTPMIRSEVLKQVWEQRTEFIPYEDWDFWLRISRKGKFFHIKEPLGDYRIHPQQSVQNVNPEKIEEVTIKVLDANTNPMKINLDEYLRLSCLEDNQDDFQENVNKAYSLAYLRAAYWYIIANKIPKAKEKLEQSRQYYPDRIKDYRWWALSAASNCRTWTGDLVKNLLGAFH